MGEPEGPPQAEEKRIGDEGQGEASSLTGEETVARFNRRMEEDAEKRKGILAGIRTVEFWMSVKFWVALMITATPNDLNE